MGKTSVPPDPIKIGAGDTILRYNPRRLTAPPGDHVFAISVHNTEAPNSDLRLGSVFLVAVEAESSVAPLGVDHPSDPPESNPPAKEPNPD